MNLIKYNGPNSEHLFSLMIDYPKYPSGCHSELQCENDSMNGLCGCLESHLEKVKQCEESAIGIENPEVFNRNHFDDNLKIGDTFPLPDSIGYEIVNKQNGVAVFDGEKASIKNKVVVRLKLKSIPEKEELQEEIFDDLFSRYFNLLHEGSSMSVAVKKLETEFIITRKP